MKAVFITFNQALTEKVDTALKTSGVRGYSKWTDMLGTGSSKGEPHLGSHTWPSMNSGVIAIVNDQVVDKILKAVEDINQVAEEQGIHAFVWNVERMV